ncbi:MAG: 2-oxoglutarate dehydrogenase E1 component [Nannocystaceae bacterium]
MEPSSVLSVHNLAFLEGLSEAYDRDQNSVTPEWAAFLREARAFEDRNVPISSSSAAQGHSEVADVVLQNHVDDLIENYRLHGHLGARVDPLGRPPPVTTPMLDPLTYELTEGHYDLRFHSMGLFEGKATLRAILDRLRNTYCRHVGVEYWHLPGVEERSWLRQRMESCENQRVPDPDEQVELFRNLAHVDNVDRFLQTKFVGAKRFSISGSESAICLLDWLIEAAAEHGTQEVMIGMAHRGRINVLMNILGKTPIEVFSEFAGSDAEANVGGGDVKYHMGYFRQHVTRGGKDVYIALAFNPSHLEAITPVIQGRVRAKQDATRTRWGFDGSIAVTLHGDAAFAGQGVVAETLNMSRLTGYTVGGTIRVILNNQIGFTTDPHDSRSGLYCTDVSHLLQAPVFHVNGDDPEAAAYVAQLALDYRQKFHREVVIDLICYRRFGHNESDDPTFTQPELYGLIKGHASVRDQYQAILIERGSITAAQCQQLDKIQYDDFDAALSAAKKAKPLKLRTPMHGIWTDYLAGPEPKDDDPHTGIELEDFTRLAGRLVTIPSGFTPHPKNRRMLETAGKMYAGEQPLNWAAAELMAYASLVDGGAPVRFTGQDAIRGTFSHRHAALVDPETGARWCPLQDIHPDQAAFEIYNSPLSEMSVVGFEFGYSLAAPQALVLWEAQFGDFVNGAQVIIDQFLSSSEDKWNRVSGLVLLLPHGYEGQGPEHSSARLERFLQLCAEDNMQIVNPTTSAQAFHLLRRQVIRRWRKPLVVMAPKSLLRLRAAFSSREDLLTGRFLRVIDDDAADPNRVERLIVCSGRLYYDLRSEQERRRCDRVAILRIEQLYPFPEEEFDRCVARFPKARSLVWAQDEPENMGAWRHVAPTLCELRNGELFPNYAGRPASASPATGSPEAHRLELQRIFHTAFDDL